MRTERVRAIATVC